MFENFYRDGVPCEHLGCEKHVTHPCENCHRFEAGRNHYWLELYHGTDATFDKFDPAKLNSDCAIDQYGSGFYFYDNAGLTVRHGNNVVIAKCHIKRILSTSKTHKNWLTSDQVESLIVKSPDLEFNLTNFGDVEYHGFDHVLSTAVSMYAGEDILHALNTLGNDFFKKEDCHILLKEFVKLTGFNCIRKSFDNHCIYVMLDERDIEIQKVIQQEDLP